MRLLVLGGTWFLGRVLVSDALRRGFEVTTFNRGRSGTDVHGVEVVRGDRDKRDDLARLVAGREWDAVVDTGGYVPRMVGQVAQALAGRTGGYAFVSTVNAYTGWPDEPLTEGSAVYDCAPDADGSKEREYGSSAYGIYKAGAERAVRRVFGDAALIVRPGVIIGPYEYVGRLPWWLGRAARGGRMLAPGDPGRTIQPIDVRDVAAFILDCLGHKTAGVFNLAAPLDAATMGEFIGACVEVTGAGAQPVWVSDAFLVEQGIGQWTELPLWRTSAGAWALDPARAAAAGLACRPLRETVADTWAWLRAGNLPVAHPRQAEHGIAPDREQALLALWDRLKG